MWRCGCDGRGCGGRGDGDSEGGGQALLLGRGCVEGGLDRGERGGRVEGVREVRRGARREFFDVCVQVREERGSDVFKARAEVAGVAE